MKKQLSTPVQYLFAVSPALEFCFGWMDGETMSNAIVADQLLAANATNNRLRSFVNFTL